MGQSLMAALDPHTHIAMLERQLQWAQLKIQSLEERWRQHLIRLYGPKSETLSAPPRRNKAGTKKNARPRACVFICADAD